MQMTLHGKHTHKSETRKQQRALRKSYHTHTYTQKRTKKTIKSFAVTLTLSLMSHCTKDPYSRFTYTRVCVCELFGQSIWVEETRRITEAITLLREETMEIVHTHTHTLKDALIKHGSKNWRKTKRNERQHSFDSYSSSALTRLTRGVSSLFVTLKQV